MAGVVRSGERRRTLTDLQLRGRQAAAGFESLGVGKGECVALMLRNDFAFFEASAGAGQLGAYPVPVNWHFTAEEAGYLLRDCGAKAVVIHADLLPEAKRGIPDGVAVLVVETPPEIAAAYGIAPERCAAPRGSVIWDEWLDRWRPRPMTGGSQAPGAIIYTGGTTGRPKGVRRAPPTPEQSAATLDAVGHVFGLRDAMLATQEGRQPPRVTTVMTGPMYHSAPNTYGAFALRTGGEVILQPRFDPEALLALIEARRVTHLHMVPTMFVRLLKAPEEVRRRYDLTSLQFVVHAAAPCPPHVKRAMIEWWGPIINEYYGSTETSAVTFCTSEEWLANPGTVGRPLPGVGLKILGQDGFLAPPGEAGDVYCRLRTGADFTYHGDDAKRRSIALDDLVNVGDIGYLNSAGYLFLCDRKNHVVISGGANIYPAEIECEILKIDGVADCAVFGIPDDEFGEALCAWIQPSPGVELDATAVRGSLAHRLARYKIPKVIEFSGDLPREDSGKIFKRKLREPYWLAAGRQI
jgi:long-chain acyl-CoA synthetase